MSETIQHFSTALFGLAVIHTFCVKYFLRLAHKYPKGSIQENILHFMAETEVVFGLWASALFVGIASIEGSVEKAVHYIESLNFNEPKFVLAVMVVAATRPIVRLAEKMILIVARLFPVNQSVSFYFVALTLGCLIGSLITEPAAMTLLAVLLKRRYFDKGISLKFAYATIGLLFVNISIGGTLTHFAAPPVLMVAARWNWDMAFMFLHFGWRAVLSCLIATTIITFTFRKELASLKEAPQKTDHIPLWLTGLHLFFLAIIVFFAHHPDVFFGIFMIFLGIVIATKEYQDQLKLREALLVGFFLAGLVTLGSLQTYWLQPLITSLDGSSLFFATTALTAITDNAAITYLGSLVPGISDDLKYAIVAGAVAGGGLTVIANAPNPAGVGILQNSEVFKGQGISPLKLLVNALLPTLIAIICFWFI